MTQEQIEAVKQLDRLLAEFADHGFIRVSVIRPAITALQARVDEAERERDEARALNTGFAMTLDEDRQDHEEEEQHLRAKVTELEAEVARLTKERDQQEKLKWKARDANTPLEADRAHYKRSMDLMSARLVARDAAIAESLKRLDDATDDFSSLGRALIRDASQPLRNLTKPDTPSERIMSDKDRENPVEGAHPLTKPEGEDALVEALREVLPTHNREVGKLWAANLRKALASRGLVRGEGV